MHEKKDSFRLFAFILMTKWKCSTIVSVTFCWQKLVAAGTMFSELAPLWRKDANEAEQKLLPLVSFFNENLLWEQFQRHKRASNICILLNQMPTYVAAAETCPLLVRWAPKCICMHLSRQQRSGWKQNHTQEDTCSWASPLVTAKGSLKWTEKCCHLRVSSLYCSPEERSLPLLQTSQFLCAPRRAVIRLFLSKVETRNCCIEKKWTWKATGLAVAVSTSLLCGIQRVRALPLSERSPTQRQIQLCASLPPGVGFCYVPWLAGGPVFTPTQLPPAGGVGFH